MSDERAQHTVHRLEAFSDIVMGFCLAQIGLGLVLPNDAGDGAKVWLSATFFLCMFCLIALLWWFHHRTFSTYFVLNTGMVVINFTMLGALVLSLYFMECFVHVVAAGKNPSLFFQLLTAGMIAVYGLLGLMLAVGLRLKRAELPSSDVRWAVERVVNIAVAIALFSYAAFGLVRNGHLTNLGLFFAVAIASFAMNRLVIPLWLRRALPERP